MALMAETDASILISELVDWMINYANTSWWPSPRSVKAETKRLQSTHPQIRLALAAVQGDRIRERDRSLDALMWQLRDALEAADDVLDEIKYYEMEDKVKAQDRDVSGRISGCKRKLVDFVKNVFVNDGFWVKLRGVVEEFEHIASDFRSLQMVNELDQERVVHNFHERGPFLIERRVVGREKEKEAIVEWLTGELHGENEGFLSAFSIFGMGGMGKTTLAQLVVADERVIEKFDLTLWVSVSDYSDIFDPRTVIKKMVEAITKQSCGFDSLCTLQIFLKDKMASKKFLLVLDDVWRDDTMSEWEKIAAPLRYGARGSKILVATRMESVAKMFARLMKMESKYLYLDGLEENDFMTLFDSFAFAGRDPSNYQHLRKTCNQIAKNIPKNPLAAKVIGTLLNNDLSFDSWNEVLNEDTLNPQLGNNDIMGILKMSYYQLPPHLQLCFRYCSIFPQDYKFQKKELVRMWTASGLISRYAHGNRRLEDVAGEYLDQLAKSFFLDDVSSDECYVIHGLLHELARTVSENECLRITGDAAIYIPQTTRHLYVEKVNDCTFREIHNLKKLRTLVINSIDHAWDQKLKFNEIISSVKNLRLLKLRNGKYCKVPSTIGKLIHLRYLSIDSSWVLGEQLRTLHRFYHLEELIVVNYLDMKENKQEGM